MLLEELEKAQSYIFLEYFIISESTMWWEILNVLESKAQEGVDVRVIYDGVGSAAISARDMMPMLSREMMK